MTQKNDCGFYIKHINDALQRDSNNVLRKQDLTLSQMTVLLMLQNAPNQGLSLKEVEKQLQVAQSTAAGIIVRLEQKGFVEGFGSAEDKRIKMVRITQAGLNCCETSHIYMNQAEERLLSSLTEAERMVFLTLLKKVSASMK